jgi:NADH-quinone oxidoreductase subunit G
VRFCNEITHTNELGIVERGDQAEITTFPGKKLDNPYAGNTVDICPVGALTSKDFRFKIRVWFLRETKSVCPGCARGCNIDIHYHNQHVYRLKPRRNDAVNETWMCDAGRLSYKAINDNRVLYPQLQHGGQIQPASWQVALEHAVGALQRHGGTAVGIVAAPQGTNEDCYLLARLASDVLATSHVVLYPGVPGYEDDFLIRADKNPNTRGAQDMGLPAPASTAQLEALARAIEQGAVRVLYAIGVDLVAAFGAEAVARWATQLDCLIVQTSNSLPGCEQAHVLLPSATYAERDGTFTNCQGRVQRINAAFAPRGEALPAWQIYTRLARGLGHDWAYAAAEAVLNDIAVTIPGYAGLSYAKIGDLGYAVTPAS